MPFALLFDLTFFPRPMVGMEQCKQYFNSTDHSKLHTDYLGNFWQQVWATRVNPSDPKWLGERREWEKKTSYPSTVQFFFFNYSFP